MLLILFTWINVHMYENNNKFQSISVTTASQMQRVSAFAVVRALDVIPTTLRVSHQQEEHRVSLFKCESVCKGPIHLCLVTPLIIHKQLD